MRRALVPLLALVATGQTGCLSALFHGQAGGVVGTSGAVGGSLEGSVGAGLGSGREATSGMGVELTGRTKFTTRVLSGALGAGLYLASSRDTLFMFGHAGAHLVQVDVIGDTPYVSALSPYATLGFGVNLRGSNDRGYVVGTRDALALTVGLGAEYNVRFAVESEGFFSLNVGLASFGASGL